MSLLDRIKLLASTHQLSLAELERKLDFSNGSLRKWDSSTPSGDKIEKVADYFNVSTDYLLGRTDNPKIADEQNDPNVDNLTKQAIVLFRKETEGLSEAEKVRFNTALESLMKSARQLIQDDSSWK
mgnify:CR=1 FL=1|jgi:transcriptional regulator with XRE-family HTH domain